LFALLAARAVSVLDTSVGRPSLDDVFLRETGRSLRDTGVPGADAADTTVAEEVAA
jgi:hypothetical protein